MGTRNTNVGATRFNQHDNQRTTIHELRRVRTGLAEVVAAVIAGTAGNATFAEQQAQTALLTTIDTAVAAIQALVAKGDLQILEQEATDLVQTFVYLDPGVADERVSTITYTSPVDFPAITVVKTFVYAGGAGTYRVSTITLS